MKTFTKENLNTVAYPLGGIGAGMFCVEGTGSFNSFSFFNEPDIHFEPTVFSGLCVKNEDGSTTARVIEGQVPYRKIFGRPGVHLASGGNGQQWKNYGLARMKTSDFSASFPAATLNFLDPDIPLKVSLVATSPFIPGNDKDSCLPVASLTYRFENPTNAPVEAIYSFHSLNFMNAQNKADEPKVREGDYVFNRPNGFIVNHTPPKENPTAQGSFYAHLTDESTLVNTDWFYGGWFDNLTMLWNSVKAGETLEAHQDNNKSPGGSLMVPFTLREGESKEITVLLAWYMPKANLRHGWQAQEEFLANKLYFEPWYTGQFAGVDEVMDYWKENHNRLKRETEKFTTALEGTTLPQIVMETVMNNLTILKSPTILRQKDGRIWAWEGCSDTFGSCHGSCTHVWNYAQALCHLFPALERTLRYTEYHENQNDQGHQDFRATMPPIRPTAHTFYAAADGQLGGIMKMYREWRISGDTQWLNGYYVKMKNSIEYCIKKWDPKENGVLTEPHHNTYDIEFWGADIMCTSYYLGALLAMSYMAEAAGESGQRYYSLYLKGKKYAEETLFNGEYFYQKTQWQGLEEEFSVEKQANGNKQCAKLLELEGPKYQYGTGCLSDGLVGAWIAKMCGLGDILDPEKTQKHLLSIYRYNFKTSLRTHDNPQRPGFAVGEEGGLLLCTWPKGNKPSLPFVYSDEVWTGIEHHVASHLFSFGYSSEATDILKTVRERYDGAKRNPFDEYECGHWYGRALSSYGLLQGYTGIRYDAVNKTLYANKQNMKEYTSFLCTETGYGLVHVVQDNISLDVFAGDIDVENYVLE